jgi:hypothetical protein
MRVIISVRIFCDGNSFGKSDNAAIGFYVDDAVQTNPAIILWSTSKLAQSTDATTIIDEYFARSYAPIIEGVSDVVQSFSIDSPVVNNSGVTLTISNHDKALLYIESQGLSLMGLPLRITLNQFNESGTLIGGKVLFSGTIVDIQSNETTVSLSCENTKFARNSNILKPGEQFIAGVSSEFDNSYFKLKRNENFKTIYNNNGQTSFLLIGGFDTITSLVKKRTYQVFLKNQISGVNLTGWWMYVDQSGTESKGEYRKIISCTYVEYVSGIGFSIDEDIAPAAIKPYGYIYNDGPTNGTVLQLEIEGAFTEGLIADLCTYIQFIKFEHNYIMSKKSITGTVDRLYSKIDDQVVPFGDIGYSCQLNVDGSIDLEPDYPLDDNTIVTYTGLSCKALALIGNNGTGIDRELTLREWIYELGESTSEDPYKKMQMLSCAIHGGFTEGFFSEDASTVNIITHGFNDYGGAFDKRIHSSSFSSFYNVYTKTSTDRALIGIQFELPTIPDNFKFKSVHLGLAIRSTCTKGLSTPNGIVCITKQAYGTAKKHFNAPLDHTSGATYINTIPQFYLDAPMSEDYFYTTDWQWKTNDSAPQTRLTGLEATKLQDVDTVEKYRKILKVGLFFPRDSGINIEDTILLYEIAAIFKHENSLSEVLI